MSRTEKTIARANAEGRPALVGYLPLGFPDINTCVEAIIAMSESGVDVIELGPPYSDPVMDGEVIQQATKQALSGGFKFAQLFDILREVTAKIETPILIMSYWNLVLQYGVERFAADLKNAGGAGMITPDITPESAAAWIAAADKHSLDKIFLAAPTSSDERLEMIAKECRGFVYAVSTMGITGARAELDAAAQQLVERLKKAGAKTVCVGIGVSLPEHAKAIGDYAEGAVVGTAMVRALANSGVAGLRLQTETFMSELKAAAA